LSTFEGNGQQPADLVELGAVQILNGEIRKPVSWLVKPDQPITHFARKIHGITNDDVAERPLFARISGQTRTSTWLFSGES
jgi:exodeoxyribonuclease X